MITNNRFQGDPAIKITERGAHMLFIGGQPVMDQGLENAAQISLFTKLGWWGNTLISDPNRKIGSSFQENRTIVEIQTLNDYRDAADAALKWMKDVGLASKIEIEVMNPYTDHIYTTIKIYPPGQDAEELIFLNNGLNWIYQAGNPANERLTNVL